MLTPAFAMLAPTADAQDFSSLGNTMAAEATTVAADSISARGAIERLRSENRPEGTSVELEYLWNADGGHNRWSAAVSQEFLWPGAYATAKRLESATDRMLRNQSRAYRRQTAADAESMLIALAAGITKLEAQKEICTSLDSLIAHYNKAFLHGEATILDINKLRVESARANVAMQQIIAGNTELRTSLQALSPGAHLPDDATLAQLFMSPLPATPMAADDVVTLSEAARQDEIAQAEAAMTHARRSALPSLSAGYAHAYEDATHFNGISIGIGLPSYGSGAARRASAAEALSVKLRAIAASSEETARRYSLTTRVESLKDALSLLEPAVNGISAAELKGGHSSTDKGMQRQLLAKALGGGQISVLEFINESNYLTEASMECIDLRAEILQTIAMLRPYTEPADLQ